jgi:hypothetical protein
MTVSAARESLEFRSDFASRTYLPAWSMTSATAKSTLAQIPLEGYAVVARSSLSSSSVWSRPGRLAEKAFFMCAYASLSWPRFSRISA